MGVVARNRKKMSNYMTGRVGSMVFDTGIFALSGAVTNWLAIYMLFEKVSDHNNPFS